MSEKRRGRKRHVVQGDVQKIERKGQGLGLGVTGEEKGFFRKMLSLFRKNKRYE